MSNRHFRFALVRDCQSKICQPNLFLTGHQLSRFTAGLVDGSLTITSRSGR
jgi:hypothetical protein